ncbi:MAG TPA: hypothetical protein VI583_01575 [Cyclobacteriaceae bacterium]|nr:hypothetical protein [Cyclobacteriaceae bacterium]
MGNMKEQFAQFAENNAAFIETWGNWIIVISFILILTMISFSMARIRRVILKVWIIIVLLTLLASLTFIAILINSP